MSMVVRWDRLVGIGENLRENPEAKPVWESSVVEGVKWFPKVEKSEEIPESRATAEAGKMSRV